MENILKVYAIQWHNEKNFDDKYFGTDLDSALNEFDNCDSKESFSYMKLIEIEYIGEKPIYNKEYLVNYLRGYYHMPLLKDKIIKEKLINDLGCKPKLDTGDLANYISFISKPLE